MQRFISNLVICCLFLSSCSKSDSTSSGGDTRGVGGSTARFTIAGDHLYTVSDQSLTVFDISKATEPVQGKTINLGFGIETIFPNGENLFIGTQTGMQIFNISDPAKPKKISDYAHIRSCDPVVTNSTFAFVTLRSGSGCGNATNELQVLNVSNPSIPEMIKSYPMLNPKGLAVDRKNLFVCDEGLKLFDASNVRELVLKKQLIIDVHDVIATNNLLIAVGKNGMYQFDYSADTLRYLSHILVDQP